MSSRPVVLDASVAICLLLGEPQSQIVEEALRRWTSEDRPIVVPQHFWLEIVNRIGRISDRRGAEVVDAIHRLDTYGLETFDADRSIVVRVIDLVERFRLTAYDALYLAITDVLDAELATFDHALIVAAGERATALGDDHRLHERPVTYEHEVTWPRYREASAFLAKLRADALRDYERESPSAVPGPRR